MTRLSVNINKIATLRNARGGDIPNVLEAVRNCEKFGAEGITVHPRPDERHIKRADVIDIRPIISTEFNIEGNPSRSFLDLVAQVKPDQVTLVPDPHYALTSNQGWDVISNMAFLKDTVSELKSHHIRTSIFVDADPDTIEAAGQTGTDRIELYTEPYAKYYSKNKEAAITPFRNAAIKAGQLELGINAGHDLNLENLSYFAENIPGLLEVSIGHALIADALYLGLKNAIQLYKKQLYYSKGM